MKNKRLMLVAVFVLLLLSDNGYPQGSSSAYILQRRNFSIFAAGNSDCPVELIDPKVIGFDNGRISKSYSMWNRSRKDILSLVISEISWDGKHEARSYITAKPGELFLSGENIPNPSFRDELSLSPLSDGTARKLGFAHRPKEVILLLVVEAKFSDGTVYSAKRQYAEIGRFIRELRIRPNMNEVDASIQEQNFRSFVQKQMDSGNSQ